MTRRFDDQERAEVPYFEDLDKELYSQVASEVNDLLVRFEGSEQNFMGVKARDVLQASLGKRIGRRSWLQAEGPRIKKLIELRNRFESRYGKDVQMGGLWFEPFEAVAKDLSEVQRG